MRQQNCIESARVTYGRLCRTRTKGREDFVRARGCVCVTAAFVTVSEGRRGDWSVLLRGLMSLSLSELKSVFTSTVCQTASFFSFNTTIHKT